MSIVITGSVAYDYLMNYPGRFREHFLADQMENVTLSFLVDSMQRLRGGVATNMAYTHKLLGGDPIIFSTVGQDFGDYRAWLDEQGFETSHLIEIEDEFTASFFGNTDSEGNQISSFYSGAMQRAQDYTLADRGLTNAALVLIGAGDPTVMLNQAAECKRLNIPFALDPSWQVARFSAEEMKENFPGATYLFCNEYEASVIQSKTGWSLDDLRAQVETLVITRSEKGSTIYTSHSEDETGEGETIDIPAASVERVINPTGAGDAYRGGFFAAQQKGLPLAVCGRVGALAAVYVLEHEGPIDHRFTLSEFGKRYEENFGVERELRRLKD